MKVTKYDIEQWLNTQIEARRLQNISLTINTNDDGIDDALTNLSHADAIHIGGESVRFLADALNLDLCVTTRRKDSENPYEVFVLYKNEKFFGIETEEEYKERGAVV